MLYASTGTIGINESATVMVTSTTPATLTLDSVPDGQYIIVANVTTDAPWVDLSATSSDDYDEYGYQRTVYLSENTTLNAFTGVITVKVGSTITLSTYSDYTLTVGAYLMPLKIGEFNDYYLSNIALSSQAPKQIAFSGATGDYIVSVETYSTIESDAVIAFNGDALTKNPNMYDAYTEEINLTNGATLTLSTTNENLIFVNLSLIVPIEVNDVLPAAADNAETFALYEGKNYRYTAEDDGYFTVSKHTSEANADMAIVVKTNPNDYTGTTIEGENYPVYMEEGEYYYFYITYMGTPWEEGVEPPQSVNAWFTVSEWTAPTLTLNTEAVYVPVTAADESVVKMSLSVDAGTYDLNLLNIPFDILFGGYTVTAHIGSQEVELEWGYAEITISSETEIWFTTDYSVGFTAGVTLAAPVADDTITLNDTTTITLGGGNSSATYYIENLEGGNYRVTLSLPDGAQIKVEVSTSDQPVITAGGAEGTFGVTLYGDETTTTVALVFTNCGSSEVTFSVVVTQVAATES